MYCLEQRTPHTVLSPLFEPDYCQSLGYNFKRKHSINNVCNWTYTHATGSILKPSAPGSLALITIAPE